MPEIDSFSLTLVIVGLIAGCVFARSIRLVLMLALAGGAYYIFRNGVDLDNASGMLAGVASTASDMFTQLDLMSWFESVLDQANS